MRKFLAVLLLGPLAAAPSQLPAPQTFKIGTKLVEVDVVARDRHGPATDTLLDNGKVQQEPDQLSRSEAQDEQLRSAAPEAPA